MPTSESPLRFRLMREVKTPDRSGATEICSMSGWNIGWLRPYDNVFLPALKWQAVFVIQTRPTVKESIAGVGATPEDAINNALADAWSRIGIMQQSVCELEAKFRG